ncbi:hydantoinase B/oxoprolinase family protein [Candidatus Halobonum tyrrellensis]|uniref:5-oxoprolinase n=1 Tax=Candidatus Halobonum tyrrellensis G22 TaxID=1324957 RepID=V4HFA3_9EURY|nr:hydantoinase B/oxoprolinase family protein [Candidatus Halobonum tyrrellensis]ESP88783.1 5-oxoprolinase [Candidatus Halobonum tyrrellensis G22]
MREAGAGGAGGDSDGGRVDSVTLEVIRNGCEAVAEEMNGDLVRTGYSPNIKERRDCSTALFDAGGEMVAQAETMPVHLGAMPFSVAAAVEAHPPETLEPGDSVLLNDPFRGGAHLPDLTLVTPVYDRDGDLLAFAANRAHHADVGGSTAGSVAADSTEIYQEGLRIPPVKFERGTGAVDDDGLPESEVRGDVLDLVLANVRTPDERRGDLRAQTAANATGRRRFRDLADTHGATLRPALEEIKAYSERRMRAEIADLPDGIYAFSDVLDDDGRGNEDLPVEVSVTVEGDSVTVDFAGTAPQTAGPVNAVFAVTASATYYAVRCVTDPDIPPNHGCYRPIDIEAPEGTIVNPEPPAAVVGGNLETSQRVTDAVLGALAEADPEAVVAGCQGTMNNVTLGGTDPRSGTPYAFYETQGGGFGGRASGDGMDGVHVHMSNTLNTPAEVLETAYPLRVERYELRPDSGGAGEFRGGLGLRRDIEVRDHTARLSLLAERHESRPYGLAGGESGGTGAAYLFDGGNDEGSEDGGEKLPAKHTRDLPPGSVVSVRTPGGGGYGDPADRDPDAVARDVELGKLTPAAARERYGYDADDADGADPGGTDADE